MTMRCGCSALAPDVDVAELQAADARVKLWEAERSRRAWVYMHRLYETPLVKMLKAGEVPWFFGKAQLFVDSPDKAEEDGVAEGGQLLSQLRDSIARAEQEVIFISPYFVPGKKASSCCWSCSSVASMWRC